MNTTSKSAKYFITISLLSVLALSSFVGAANAFISGQTPANTQYVISEGMASTDNMVGTTATTGGPNWQYSYDVNQFGCEADFYSCASLPGYSASPVCAVSDNPISCTYDKSSYALPPGYDVVFSANKSLRIAMDQYGEFVSTKANTGQCLNSFTQCGVAGLAYGSNEKEWQATESFASTAVNPQYYIQGWTFQMNYTHTGTPYSLDAYSLYGDFAAVESARNVSTWFPGSTCQGYHNGDYDGVVGAPTHQCEGPNDVKAYTGLLIPTGIQVLYDSQRLSVFRTTITIYDGHFKENVANVTFTTVFNKDSKTVIVYKDLKILLPTKVLDSIQALAFSEEYELDLAANMNPSNSAYIHYYHSTGLNQSTVYQDPLTGSTSYDIINAFDAKYNINFFAGYWPNATEYSVYTNLVPGQTGVTPCVEPDAYYTCTATLPTGTAQHDIPLPTGEPSTPWVTVQWKYDQSQYPKMLAFLAKDQPRREIRFVEVFGMTDLNSGTGTGTNPYPSMDLQSTSLTNGYKNQIGVEVQYLLQQIFNPESLNTVNGQNKGLSMGETGGCYYGAGETNIEWAWSYNCNHPFLWTAVGQPSAAIDSAGAALLSPMQKNVWENTPDAVSYPAPFALFDKNSTGQQGSIPYGLCQLPDMNGCTGTKGVYYSAHSNSVSKTGLDTTKYQSTFLQNFYDSYGVNNSLNIANIQMVQPIHGGCVSPWNETAYWFMPAKSPFTESWVSTGKSSTTTCSGASFEKTDGVLSGTSENPYYNAVISNSEGIITVGGPKANQLSRYFNDWNFAIDREGTTPFALVSKGTVTGKAPTSNSTLGTIDFFPISTWASSSPSPGAYGVSTWFRDTNNTVGFAVISIARDTIGTRGFSVYGWNGRDTYWASAWASQWLGEANPYYNNPFDWLPPGTVSIILAINYKQTTAALPTWEPSSFSIMKALGTITELGSNAFLGYGAGGWDTFTAHNPIQWTSNLQFTDVSAPTLTGAIDITNNVNLYSCSSVSLTGYSTIHSVGFDWFSTKLPTCTSASVEFDGQ